MDEKWRGPNLNAKFINTFAPDVYVHIPINNANHVAVVHAK